MDAMEGSMSSSSSPEASCWPREKLEDVKQMLVTTRMELECLRVTAKIQKEAQDARLRHLQEVLEVVKRERDEALERCNHIQQNLSSSTVQQQPHFYSAIDPMDWLNFQNENSGDGLLTSGEESQISGNEGSTGIADAWQIDDLDLVGDLELPAGLDVFPSLERAPAIITQQQQQQQQQQIPGELELNAAMLKPSLPERGKLLQAVTQAGPLLQTLLLAGQLPQWRHPPPIFTPLHQPVSLSKPNPITKSETADPNLRHHHLPLRHYHSLPSSMQQDSSTTHRLHHPYRQHHHQQQQQQQQQRQHRIGKCAKAC